MRAIVVGATTLALLFSGGPTAAQQPLDGFAEFEALCMAWDGDLTIAEELSAERGYQSAQDRANDVEILSRAGRSRFTFAWTKTVGDTEVQLVVRPQTFIQQGSHRVLLDQCSVAITPGRRSALRGAIARELGLASFRQMGSSVFAWTVGPKGREPVRRREFDRALLSLMDDRGLRMLTVAQHNNQVILSYVVPARLDCRVRETYSATEPNILCGVAGD